MVAVVSPVLVMLGKRCGVAPAEVDSVGDEICGGMSRSTLYFRRFSGGGRPIPLLLLSGAVA